MAEVGSPRPGMLRLTGLSYAYPSVTAAERARFYLSGGDLREALAHARAHGHDLFLLPTCLRVEMVWTGGPELAADLVGLLYGDPALISGGVIRTDEEAFLHLCRVAAGLESAVVGEAEVFAQFRQSVRGCIDGSAGANELARVLQTVIGVGRMARRLLAPVSDGSLAVEAARIVSSYERIAILGGGAMASVVARQLEGRDISVLTRRPMSVAGLQSSPWDEVPEVLATYPAVVSTVPGGGWPFNAAVHLEAMGDRRHVLHFVDLGMPPAFAHAPTDVPLRYLGVDDVASSIDVVPATDAGDAVEREAQAGWRRLATSPRAGSIIAGMVDQAERAVDEEVLRFLNRLPEATDPEPVLRQLAHTVARRVLHRPISYVGSTGLAAEELHVVAEAFGLDDE